MLQVYRDGLLDPPAENVDTMALLRLEILLRDVNRKELGQAYQFRLLLRTMLKAPQVPGSSNVEEVMTATEDTVMHLAEFVAGGSVVASQEAPSQNKLDLASLWQLLADHGYVSAK